MRKAKQARHVPVAPHLILRTRLQQKQQAAVKYDGQSTSSSHLALVFHELLSALRHTRPHACTHACKGSGCHTNSNIAKCTGRPAMYKFATCHV
jgi:hypothetical protein